MENQKTPEEYTGVKGLVRSIYQETATSFVDSNNNYVTVFPDKIEYIKTQDICTGGAKTSTGSVSATGSGNINPSAISSGRIASYLTVGDLVAIDGTRGLISLGIPSSGVVGDNSYMYMNASGIFGYHGTDTFPWFFAATKDMVFGSRTYHGGDFFIGEIDSAYLWWQYDEHKLIIAGDISISGDIESSNFEYDPFTGTLVGYKLEYYGGNAYFGGAIVSGNSFITGNTSIYGNNVTIAGQSIVNVGNVSDSTALTIPAGLLVDGTAITIANDGTISANITLSWTAETDPRFDHYQIRYKKSSFTYYQYISSNSNTITIDGLTPNTSYDFAVSSVNKYGIPSTYSSTVTYTTATSTTAPAKVSGVSAVGGIQYVIVEWISNSEKDLSSYNVYRNTVNNPETATLIGNCKTNYFVDGGRTGGTEYFYWVKAVNTSGLVSTDFSTVASATPRNVTNDDVVNLASSKVLIDGVTYLSNWRKSGDLTKIDGGSISTGSITTTQLNFTPVIDGTIIASINASEEGIKISGEHIAISGSTTFSSGYDPITKVNKLGGSYASASSGARVLIFPDTNTGLQIIDNGGADVFKAIIGGTNVGDVIIGNYTGGQGIFYDKSEAKTIFKGSMIAGNITGVTITGGTIQTAISGKRVEIKTEGKYENSIAIFDSTGNIGIHLFDNSILGGWTNSAIIFDQSYGLRVAFPFPTSDQGYIYFLRNSSQSSGTAAPIIKGSPSLAIEVNSITLSGTTRTSWPSSFSGNLSDLYINTTKSWGSYGITGLGTITPYSNNSYSLGSSSYKWNNVYSTYGTFDYLGKSLNANSYGITGLGTITPYSNGSYNLGSSSYYWNYVYGINIIPSGKYTSYLGNSSYHWDYFYVDTIRGAGGTDSIEIENNAFTRCLFPADNVKYDIGGSGFFYKNVFTQSLRLRTGQSTNPANDGEIRYYDVEGGGYRGRVRGYLMQFDGTLK